MANTNLHKAKQAKNDELYTQLTGVEKELKHYKIYFKDKTVFATVTTRLGVHFGNIFI